MNSGTEAANQDTCGRNNSETVYEQLWCTIKNTSLSHFIQCWWDKTRVQKLFLKKCHEHNISASYLCLKPPIGGTYLGTLRRLDSFCLKEHLPGVLALHAGLNLAPAQKYSAGSLYLAFNGAAVPVRLQRCVSKMGE